MSMRSALVAALVMAGAATTAPMPYSPDGSAEALLEAGSAERAQALAQFLRTPDVASQAVPDQKAGAYAWLATRLKAEVVGTGVRLTMGGQGLKEREALAVLRLIVRVATAEPAKSEMARLQMVLDQRRMMEEEMAMMGGKGMIWRRRLALRGGDIIEYPATDRRIDPSVDIRLNRPTVKGAPRLVVR